MSKILVIEDETAVRENLVELLNEEGYEVVSAGDGEEGAQRVWEELPDLIICDIMMPKLDGFGVLARLSQDVRLANIPFVFLTARIAREDLRKGMEMGADDYITKPFKRSEVLQAITTRLGRLKRLEAQTKSKLIDMRNRISTDLPHELMTPLSITIGFSEILVEQVDFLERDEIRKLASDIHHSAHRLLHMVENALLFAELQVLTSKLDQSEAFTANPLPVMEAPLMEIIENKAQLAGRSADLTARVQPAHLSIGEQHLQKILDEVLDNSFKFSRAGSPVFVEGALAPEKKFYRLRIRDRGRGMTAEQIRRVDGLTPFDRHLYTQQSLGLGLVLVQQICQLYHGHLNIQSIPGEGTQVEMLLPVHPAV